MNFGKTSIIKQPLSISAWWKAFKLFIPIYGLAIACPIYLFWKVLVFGVILILNNISSIDMFFIAFGIFIITLLIYEAIIIFYTFFIKLLWSNPPKWLCPPRTISKHFYHLAISFIAMVPVVLINVVYIILVQSTENLTNTDIRPIYVVDFLLKTIPVWIITSAFLYNLEEQIRKNRKHKNFNSQS